MLNFPLIILSYLSLFIYGLTDNVRGPFLLEIQHYFKISATESSLIFALSSMAGFFMTFFSLKALKAFPPKFLLQISCILLSFSMTILLASKTFPYFLVGMFIMGFCLAFIGLIPNVFLSTHITEQYRSRVLSGLHSMYGLSSFLAPIFVTVMIGLKPGQSLWPMENFQWVYGLLSMIPILFLFIFKVPKFKKSLDFDHNQSPSNKLQLQSTVIEGNKISYYWMAFSLSFMVITEVLISSRLPSYMTLVFHLSFEKSNLYLSFFFVSLLFGRIFFTFFHTSLKTSTILFSLFGAIIAGLILGLFVHPMALPIVGFFIGPIYPFYFHYLSLHFPKSMDYAMATILKVSSLLLASMHIFVGAITDVLGIRMSFFTTLIFTAVSFAMFYRFHKLHAQTKS